ncbi:MarR family transcriptional regulator [Actinoplanes sp. NPDC051633]|uniref:MarR family winged helix-turn-helix transcriptional regulator n=1 Tax=Actinoplanes sp. NPDC051633 TaxID=3155670 RepID=UPI00343BAE9A
MDGTPPRRLAVLTSWQLAQGAARARRLVSARLDALGGSRAEFAMLATLEEFGGLSQADLGRRIGLDRSDVTALVTASEEAGLIRRERDGVDRRRMTLTMTRAGARRLGRLQQAIDEAQAEILDGFTAADRRQLATLLTRLAAAETH